MAHSLAADFRRVGRPLAQEIPGACGELRDIGGGVLHHVFGHGVAIELGGEGRRDGGAALRQGRAGLLDERAGGGFFLAAGKLDGHGVSSRAIILAHDLFRKPVPAFRDHARRESVARPIGVFTFRTGASRATHHLVTASRQASGAPRVGHIRL